MFLNWQARDRDGLYTDDNFFFFLNGNIIASGDTDQDR